MVDSNTDNEQHNGKNGSKPRTMQLVSKGEAVITSDDAGSIYLAAADEQLKKMTKHDSDKAPRLRNLGNLSTILALTPDSTVSCSPEMNDLDWGLDPEPASQPAYETVSNSIDELKIVVNAPYSAQVAAFADLCYILQEAIRKRPNSNQTRKITQDELRIINHCRANINERWNVNITEEDTKILTNYLLKRQEEDKNYLTSAKGMPELIQLINGEFNFPCDDVQPQLRGYLEFFESYLNVMDADNHHRASVEDKLRKTSSDSFHFNELVKELDQIENDGKRHLKLFYRFSQYFNIRSLADIDFRNLEKLVGENVPAKMFSSLTNWETFIDKDHPAAEHLIRQFFFEAKDDDGKIDEIDYLMGQQLGGVIAGLNHIEIKAISADVDVNYECTVSLANVIKEIEGDYFPQKVSTEEIRKSLFNLNFSNVSNAYSDGDVQSKCKYNQAVIERCVDNIVAVRNAIYEAYSDKKVSSEEFELLATYARIREVPRKAFMDLVSGFERDYTVIFCSGDKEELRSYEKMVGSDSRFRLLCVSGPELMEFIDNSALVIVSHPEDFIALDNYSKHLNIHGMKQSISIRMYEKSLENPETVYTALDSIKKSLK
ncbi:MAG: hypothetical protein ABH824_05005 [Nanoarchaeota archaeon]